MNHPLLSLAAESFFLAEVPVLFLFLPLVVSTSVVTVNIKSCGREIAS